MPTVICRHHTLALHSVGHLVIHDRRKYGAGDCEVQTKSSIQSGDSETGSKTFSSTEEPEDRIVILSEDSNDPVRFSRLKAFGG